MRLISHFLSEYVNQTCCSEFDVFCVIVLTELNVAYLLNFSMWKSSY